MGTAEGDEDRPPGGPERFDGPGGAAAIAGPAGNGVAPVDAPAGSPLSAAPPGEAVPPRRTHRWGIGAFVLAWLVFFGTAAIIGRLRGDGPVTAESLIIALSVPTVASAAIALITTVVRGNGPRIDLGLRWSWRDVGVGLAFGFGGLIVSIPASILFISIMGESTTSAVGAEFSQVRGDMWIAVAAFVVVALIAPLCEEIVYRGLLWGGVERLGAGRWLTLGVTTLLFALAHFEWERTPLLLVVAIPIGLARLYTGRLLASIVAHQVNNLLPAVVLVLGLLGLLPAA